jgi:2-polyprenyl-3-methyl-5-hydroxy-6-metoxy-1,4-benzoquinol methylase
MKFLRTNGINLEAIDGVKLRGKSFYSSIENYREQVWKKFESTINSSDSHRCPLCRSKVKEVILIWRGKYILRKCDVCDAVSPNVDFDDIEKYLKSVYQNENYHDKFIREIHAQFEYRKITFGRARYEYVSKLVNLNSHTYVLDIGCGAGYFLSVLKDNKIPSKGLEVAPSLVEYCVNTHKLNVHTSKLEEEADKKYAVITMFDVIEHLCDPVETFRSINAKLRAGGYCVAYTPSIHSVAYELMGARQNTLLPFEHLCFFSKESITYLAENSGFEVSSIETKGLDMLDYFMLKEFENKEEYVTKFGDLINLVQAVLDKACVSNHLRIVFKKRFDV